MKLKKILRVACTVIYWFALGYFIEKVVSGENTIIINVALGAYAINILIHIIKYIYDSISYDRLFKNFKKLFIKIKAILL